MRFQPRPRDRPLPANGCHRTSMDDPIRPVRDSPRGFWPRTLILNPPTFGRHSLMRPGDPRRGTFRWRAFDALFAQHEHLTRALRPAQSSRSQSNCRRSPTRSTPLDLRRTRLEILIRIVFLVTAKWGVPEPWRRAVSHSRIIMTKMCSPSATFNADGSSPWASRLRANS